MKNALALAAALVLAACSPPPQPEAAGPGSAETPAPALALTVLSERLAPAVPARREVGWAVRDLTNGAAAGQNQTLPYPMQSVFKLWLAAYVLEAAERGELRLDETITVTRADLGFPYQPIAKKVDADGYEATIEELVRYIVIDSDNPSADILLRRIGGPTVLTAWLRARGVEGISVDSNERQMHDAAGAMRAAPKAERPALLDASLTDGRNAATPEAAVEALARLHRGELLSPGATRRLLAIMAETRTGTNRVKAGLEPGWRWAHKTGSGGEMDGRSLGVNDVGLLTAPDGRVYAVAIFIAGTTEPQAVQEAWMADIARGVIAQWQADTGRAR